MSLAYEDAGRQADAEIHFDEFGIEPRCVTPDELRAHGVLYPELCNDIQMLLFYGGDSDELPALEQTFLQKHSLFKLLEVDGSQEAVNNLYADCINYVRQSRHTLLQKAFHEIESTVDSPELHAVLGILQAKEETYFSDEADSVALLAMDAALLQKVAARYGIDPREMNGGLHPQASRDYNKASFWLRENPPPKNTPEQDNETDFPSRCLQAVDYLLPQLVTLLNECGPIFLSSAAKDEFEILVVRGNIQSITTNGWVRIQSEDDAFEIALILTTTDGQIFDNKLSAITRVIYLSYMHNRPIRDVLSYIMLDNLTYSETISDFKEVCALDYHSFRTNINLTDYSDSYTPNLTLAELYLERRAFQGDAIEIDFVENENALLRAHAVSAADSKGNPLWVPPMTKDIEVHNNSNLSAKEIGQFVVSKNYHRLTQRHQSIRMLSHDTTPLPQGAMTTKPLDYDLEGVIVIDSNPTDQTVILPRVLGFTIVGYQPSATGFNTLPAYSVQYKREAYDPYDVPLIPVDADALGVFCAKLESMGLGSCAKDLGSLQSPQFNDVLGTLAKHSHYGTGSQPLRGIAKQLESLSPFIENDQLIGTCSVFGAIVKFALDELLPSSGAAVISGHALGSNGVVDRDMHAQVGFQYDGKSYITEFTAKAHRKQIMIKRLDEVSFEDRRKAVGSNLLAGLETLLSQKEGVPLDAPSKLIEALSRRAPEHFGRRILFLYKQLAQLSPSASTSQHEALLNSTKVIASLLERWNVLHDPSTNVDTNGWTPDRIARTYGNWSASEIAMLQGGLKQITALYAGSS